MRPLPSQKSRGLDRRREAFEYLIRHTDILDHVGIRRSRRFVPWDYEDLGDGTVTRLPTPEEAGELIRNNNPAWADDMEHAIIAAYHAGVLVYEDALADRMRAVVTKLRANAPDEMSENEKWCWREGIDAATDVYIAAWPSSKETA